VENERRKAALALKAQEPIHKPSPAPLLPSPPAAQKPVISIPTPPVIVKEEEVDSDSFSDSSVDSVRPPPPPPPPPQVPLSYRAQPVKNPYEAMQRAARSLFS
jgi:hypothetical protein